MVENGVLDLDSIEEIVFPGGELHFALDKKDIVETFVVSAKLRNASDIIKLILVTNILNQFKGKGQLSLYMPYSPYARQDRVANSGEPLSIKAFAQIINSLGYQTVHIIDPHSDVTIALIENALSSLNIETLLKKVVPEYETMTVIAPDAGAYKKLSKIIKSTPIVQCTKHRDTLTGKLSNLMIHTEEDLSGKDLIVVDDICDGCGTFIMLAEELKKKYQPKSLSLYVTHGIFSKGLDVLKPYYDKIYTTDSFYQGETDDFVVVEKLMENAQ